jgi:hypothetical protein
MTCLADYTYEDVQPMEPTVYPSVYITLKINYPVFTILTCHTMLALVGSSSFYILYQILNHLNIFYELIHIVSNVKNKGTYMRMWFTRDRVSLFFFHAYLLSIVSETLWVGGMAAEYCACLYFYTHYEIIKTINSSHTFRFLSR